MPKGEYTCRRNLLEIISPIVNVQDEVSLRGLVGMDKKNCLHIPADSFIVGC
jgi:hypothetical protein